MHPSFEHVTTVDDGRIDELLHGLVQDVEQGLVSRLAIVVPSPAPWPLPAYELALMCAERAWDMQVADAGHRPDAGKHAACCVWSGGQPRGIASARGAACRCRDLRALRGANEQDGRIRPGDRTLEVDRVVALPALRGPAVGGVPHDDGGFIPIDEHGKVRYVEHIWAAGDGTDFPVKFGGVAAQLGDTVARSIAALTGACSAPVPFDPVMEGVLLTGASPRRLKGGRPTGGHGDRVRGRDDCAGGVPAEDRGALPQPSPRRFGDGKRPSEAVIRQARPTRSGALAGDALIAGTVVTTPVECCRARARRRATFGSGHRRSQGSVARRHRLVRRSVHSAGGTRDCCRRSYCPPRELRSRAPSWVISAWPQMLRRKPSETPGLRLMARRGLTRTVFV